MPVVAYIANEFPSSLEPYVVDEIRELRRRGVTVIACTARSPQLQAAAQFEGDLLCLQAWQWRGFVRGLVLLLQNAFCIRDLLFRVLLKGDESPSRRLRCLFHTVLGAYYAALLKPFEVEHIHAHHGYFSSWIALVAARLLGTGYSLTLHGSDLFVQHAFLDTKLQSCDFCVTISAYNRNHILRAFPSVNPSRIVVQHLGVDIPEAQDFSSPARSPQSCMVLLSVGRLHEVKDHAFLLGACARLRDRDIDIFCLIAGEGPERVALEARIAALSLSDRVTLLGHVPREDLDPYYALADLVVLTSRSEGIPVVLMEAMARRKLVLAPAITGIPELVSHGETGYLYHSGSLDDFVDRVEWLCRSAGNFDSVREAAGQHVSAKFHRQRNLQAFAVMFLAHMRRAPLHIHENTLLQQI